MTDPKPAKDGDKPISPRHVAAEVERMLGVRCLRVTPITLGSDPTACLARAELQQGASYPAVVYKVFSSPVTYLREARNLAFANHLGDFAPKLLAHDDDTQAVVMEFIEGQQLYQITRSGSHGLVRSVTRASLDAFAEIHSLAAPRIEKLIADYNGQPPRWAPPSPAALVNAWEDAVSAAASLPEVPVPEVELLLLADELARLAEQAKTLVLFDVNPFNLLWDGRRVRIVDLGAACLGPAWLDLDLARRVGLSEAEILGAHRLYLDHRRQLGDPVAEEERFLTAADYWGAASALLAARWFQERAEGRWVVKPTLPPELLRHERFRDDVLADVWAIANRRAELSGMARAMERVLPRSICQERHLRG